MSPLAYAIQRDREIRLHKKRVKLFFPKSIWLSLRPGAKKPKEAEAFVNLLLGHLNKKET